MFLIYYFSQTYNTEKAYKIYTMSNDYVIKNGVLLTTRETSYFKIGSINNNSYNISIYYKNGDTNVVIFEGDSDSLIVNSFYDNVPINSKIINKIKDNLYIKIDNKEIKLYFNEFYKNGTLIFREWEDKHDIENSIQIEINEKIPLKIKKNFECNEEVCNKTIDNINIYYVIEDGIVYLKDGKVNAQYDVINNNFDFNSNKMNFSINRGVFVCTFGDCDEYEKMYEKYFTKIIKKYI